MSVFLQCSVDTNLRKPTVLVTSSNRQVHSVKIYLTCVTSGEPLQSVDRRLTMVDTWLLSLESAADGFAPLEVLPGLQVEDGPDAVPPAAAIRDSSSSVSPCLARGAGSTPRRVNLSASEAKQRSAPSDTCGSHKGNILYLTMQQLCVIFHLQMSYFHTP